MKQPAVAFTIAYGAAAEACAIRLRHTFKVVHPDVPFFIVNSVNYKWFAGQESPATKNEICSLRALIGSFLSQCFARVIYLDADIVIFSRLEAFFQTTKAALFTHDVFLINYGNKELPRVNNGVFVAVGEQFWHDYILNLYTCLLPPGPNYYDQFACRVLCREYPERYALYDEVGNQEFYNQHYNDFPGEWSRRSGEIYKGEAKIKLYHWAGSPDRSSATLPSPAREQVEEMLAQSIDVASDEALLQELWQKYGTLYHQQVKAIFRDLPLIPVGDGVKLIDPESVCGAALPQIHDGFLITEAPSAWEKYRRFDVKIYFRRYQPETNLFYYFIC